MDWKSMDLSCIRRDDRELFDYQQEMKSNLYEAWKKCRAVMCQMPTGTGKTHLLVSVVRDFVHTWNTSVWIVVHRMELVEQISNTLTKYGVVHGRIVAGCTITDEQVQVASIQTLTNRMRDNRMGDSPLPGLIVVDEAHHSLANSYRRLWEVFPDAYKLGVTATPCRLNKRGFKGLFKKLLESWSVMRFIEKKRLASFDYISIRPDSEEQKRVNSLERRGADGDYSPAEMGMVLDCPESIEHLYWSYRKYADGKKGIIYAVNRRHSLHICEYYRKHGVRIVSIDSYTPAKERVEYVNSYAKGEIDVIVNVDIFSEGFDCPAVEFIQLARPTLSLAKYLQQVGRGLRVYPGKGSTIILDMVGLYVRFGLPTDDRNWMLYFEGGVSGKGEVDEYRLAQLVDNMAQSNQENDAWTVPMVVIQDHEVLLRRIANDRAEVEPFEKDGLYGLRKGDEMILPPTYKHITQFIGQYAVATQGTLNQFLITKKGHLKPQAKGQKVMLADNDFVYIEVSPIVKYWLDLRSNRRFDCLPEVVRLQFLEFDVVNENYYFRMNTEWTYRPDCFTAEQLKIEGDVFCCGDILVHRGEPDKVYIIEKEENGCLIVKDNREYVYRYYPGKQPVKFGQKKIVKVERGLWKTVILPV